MARAFVRFNNPAKHQPAEAIKKHVNKNGVEYVEVQKDWGNRAPPLSGDNIF